MLRPFQIVSSPIQFVGGVAQFQFPRTTKGSSRCAIIGMTHNMTGSDIDLESAYGIIITKISVAGRNYFSGRAPLALLSNEVGGFSAPVSNGNFANRFLGSTLPHPDNYLGGNSRCSGMSVAGSEEIVIRLEQLDATRTVNQIALQCLQWPDDLDDPEQASWEAMYKDGIGETLFVGDSHEGFPGSGEGFGFSPLPQAPSARALRRLGFRGCLTTDTGDVDGLENRAANLQGFNNLLVEVDGDFSRPPQNEMMAARSILGLLNYPVANGIYDMQRNERSIVRFLSGGSGIAPDSRFLIYALHMFEGRNFRTPANGLLEAATAIS